MSTEKRQECPGDDGNSNDERAEQRISDAEPHALDGLPKQSISGCVSDCWFGGELSPVHDQHDENGGVGRGVEPAEVRQPHRDHSDTAERGSHDVAELADDAASSHGAAELMFRDEQPRHNSGGRDVEGVGRSHTSCDHDQQPWRCAEGEDEDSSNHAYRHHGGIGDDHGEPWPVPVRDRAAQEDEHEPG